jgi:hypothetical protein
MVWLLARTGEKRYRQEFRAKPEGGNFFVNLSVREEKYSNGFYYKW